MLWIKLGRGRKEKVSYLAKQDHMTLFVDGLVEIMLDILYINGIKYKTHLIYLYFII